MTCVFRKLWRRFIFANIENEIERSYDPIDYMFVVILKLQYITDMREALRGISDK